MNFPIPILHPSARARRDALRLAQRCICGPVTGHVGARGVLHGPPVSGGKCRRCVEIHDERPNRAIPVACPTCAAGPGRWCVEGVLSVAIHPARYAAAEVR